MNIKKNIKFFQALAIMIGYIIGVGMFGLPYLVSKAGIITFFLFLLFLGPTQYLLHLIYANLILATKSYHRLPGYTEIYLGKKGKNFVFAAKIFGNIGALLAYIIITGIFLNQLLAPYFGGNEFIYATILFLIEAIIVYFGIGIIAKAELVTTAFLLLVVFMITWRGLDVVNIDNFVAIDWKYILLPYGAILFSLDGGGSLPMIVKLLKRDKTAIKKVVRIGTMIPIFVIVIFVFIIIGISGSHTTPDALSGVRMIFDDGVVFFSLIFGILTMVTSFFGIAESVLETLWWDYKINRTLAWAIAVFTPYILYIVGFKNLINVISFVGAIGGGICGIVLVLIFYKMKSKKGKLILFERYHPGNLMIFLLVLMFSSGIVYTIYQFIK